MPRSTSLTTRPGCWTWDQTAAGKRRNSSRAECRLSGSDRPERYFAGSVSQCVFVVTRPTALARTCPWSRVRVGPRTRSHTRYVLVRGSFARSQWHLSHRRWRRLRFLVAMVTTSLRLHVLLLCLLRGLRYLRSPSVSPSSTCVVVGFSLRFSLLRLLLQLSYHLAQLHPTWMSLRLFLRLRSLLLRCSDSHLSSSVEEDCSRGERDEQRGRRRKTEKWPLLPSLSPILSLFLFLFLCLPLLLSLPFSLPLILSLSLFLSLPLFLFSLVGVPRWIRASCAANAVDVAEADSVYE